MLANLIYHYKPESIGYCAWFLLCRLNKVAVTVPFHWIDIVQIPYQIAKNVSETNTQIPYQGKPQCITTSRALSTASISVASSNVFGLPLIR